MLMFTRITCNCFVVERGGGLNFIVSLVIGVQTLQGTSCSIVCPPSVAYVHVSILNLKKNNSGRFDVYHVQFPQALVSI